jgi:hypothetical protein
MNTTRISEKDADRLARGRVLERPDLNPLADLLADYRSAAIGAAPQPSAALAARLDLSATPIALQRDTVAETSVSGAGARRTASGLVGLGVTVAIVLAGASGAAAVVGAGSAGLLPSGAQNAFDRVVSLIVPPGVAGTETTDRGEAPGDGSETGPVPHTPDGAPSDSADDRTTDDATEGAQQGDDGVAGNPGNGNANGDVNGSGNANGNSSGNGNSENAGTGKPAENPGNGNAGAGNSGNGNSGNGNAGNGNSGNGKGNKP